jgi:peptidoglycan/xylan/chitin deacetylase (PgdA/CDA1 family)
LPLLIERQVPVTYFVCTRHVLDSVPFPHDDALGRPLPTNSLEQLRSLASAGIEIGAHTRTHADLGTLHNVDRLYDEVVAARDELQDAVGQRVRYFAFPYGLHANLNPLAFQMAADAGYEAVCSAYGGYNFPGDDDFHLQRIHADPELLRLMNWITMDPRKRRGVPRFDYKAHPAMSLPTGAAAS